MGSTGVVEPVQTVIESISPPPSICTLEISQPLAIDSEDVTSKSKKKSKTKKSKTSPQNSIDSLEAVDTDITVQSPESEKELSADLSAATEEPEQAVMEPNSPQPAADTSEASQPEIADSEIATSKSKKNQKVRNRNRSHKVRLRFLNWQHSIQTPQSLERNPLLKNPIQLQLLSRPLRNV